MRLGCQFEVRRVSLLVSAPELYYPVSAQQSWIVCVYVVLRPPDNG